MRAETVALERAAAVLSAARRWRAASFIDEETLRRIEAEFPDPRVRPSWVWRVLTFLLATVLLHGIFLAIAVGGVGGATPLALLCLFAGASCAAVAEMLEKTPSMARRGGAGASAFWSGVLLVAGAGLLLERLPQLRGEPWSEIPIAISAVVWGAASARWGNPVFAIFSAASLFALLARQTQGRLLLVTVGLAAAALAWRRLDARSWAPPHRSCAACVLLVALAAVYLSVNTISVEMQWIERIRSGYQGTRAARALLVASAVGTALIPLVVLAWGIRSRRTFLIDSGFVLSALSLITLRHYVHLAPLWALLTVAGALLIGVALWLNRWLSGGPGRERGGFTAEPLFSDDAKTRLLQTIPVAATLGPTEPQPPEKGFVPGGGSFGGGGASEKF